LSELYPHSIVRGMRGFDHLSQFIKTFTALHLHQRALAETKGRKYVIASVSDVEVAFKIFRSIFETTRTSFDKALLDFYWDYVAMCGAGEGCAIRTLVDYYNEKNKIKKSYNTIAQYLEKLGRKGYVDKQQDAIDKRRCTCIPLVGRKEEFVYNPLEHEK
jgi:hypothetical protein